VIFWKSCTKCEGFTNVHTVYATTCRKYHAIMYKVFVWSISFIESVSDSFRAFRQLYDDFWPLFQTVAISPCLFCERALVAKRWKNPRKLRFLAENFFRAVLVSTSSSETSSPISAVFNHFPAYTSYQNREIHYFASYRRKFQNIWRPFRRKIVRFCWLELFGYNCCRCQDFILRMYCCEAHVQKRAQMSGLLI